MRSSFELRMIMRHTRDKRIHMWASADSYRVGRRRTENTDARTIAPTTAVYVEGSGTAVTETAKLSNEELEVSPG